MKNNGFLRPLLRVLNISLYFLLTISAFTTLMMLGGGGHANVPLSTIYPMIGGTLIFLYLPDFWQHIVKSFERQIMLTKVLSFLTWRDCCR